MATSYTVLETEVRDHVGYLWLNRPERMNALGIAFWEELPRAVEALEKDEAVRVIALAGRGKAFTAGLDLREMAPLLMEPSEASVAYRRSLREIILRMQEAVNRLAYATKPVIAAVHGYCLGAGVDLITACDIRLASRDAVFSVRETRIAIVADLGTLQRLPRLVPEGVAREWVFTGRDVSAEEAHAVHLVQTLTDDADALMEETQRMAQRVAANSPLAVQGSKHIMEKSRVLPEKEALEYVALWNTAFLHSEDLKEAIQAFLEKRTPTFTGR